jgi:hypothetical protein
LVDWIRIFQRAIDLAAALFLLVSLILLVAAGASWLAGLSNNRTIAALRADQDVKVKDDASVAVIFGRTGASTRRKASQKRLRAAAINTRSTDFFSTLGMPV